MAAPLASHQPMACVAGVATTIGIWKNRSSRFAQGLRTLHSDVYCVPRRAAVTARLCRRVLPELPVITQLLSSTSIFTDANDLLRVKSSSHGTLPARKNRAVSSREAVITPWGYRALL